MIPEAVEAKTITGTKNRSWHQVKGGCESDLYPGPGHDAWLWYLVEGAAI